MIIVYHVGTDIDECNTHNGGCGQECRNSNGNYICDCWDGFYLALDRFSCYGKNFKKGIIVRWKRRRNIVLIIRIIYFLYSASR